MSSKIQKWAWEQQLKSGPKLTLMALADESNDQGMVFLGREKLAAKIAGIDYHAATPEELDNAARSLRRTMKTLIDENYVMTGRRQRKWSRGRAIDVIFLNVRGVDGVSLYDSRDDVPGELPNPFLFNEPVDNSTNVLGDNLSGKKVSPSQDLGDNLSGKTSERVFTGQNRTSYRTKPHILPDKTGSEESAALIGTRARLTLNNPDNPQSVGPGSTPVKNSADGQTDRKSENSSPRITRGVNHSKLRQDLYQAQLDTSAIEDDVLSQIITIVFSRATQPVRSPQRFAFSCISKEFHELVSLAESVIEQENPAPAPQRLTCPIHHADHLAGRECPGCRADRLAAPSEAPWSPPKPQNLHRTPRFHRETQTA